jgi:hypothetical protein
VKWKWEESELGGGKKSCAVQSDVSHCHTFPIQKHRKSTQKAKKKKVLIKKAYRYSKISFKICHLFFAPLFVFVKKI